MACFIVPATEAIITTVATKALEKRESKSEYSAKIPFSRKLKWLNKLLWGGSALLAFEHVWHGEVTPWFPFLTNAATPESTSEMLHEMATAGVCMAAIVTVVWIGMLLVSKSLEKRALKALPAVK